LAERARELAPPSLREQVRAAIEMSEPQPRWWRKLRTPVAAGAAVVVLVAAGLGVKAVLHAGGQPKPIEAALAAFRSHRVAMSGAPAHVPIDLSAMGLELQAGARTDLGGIRSDVFMYRGSAGHVYVFLGSRAFPEARGARERTGTVHGWQAEADGVSLLCADVPVSYLVMGTDRGLVHQVEAAIRSSEVQAAR